eukprot:GHVS01012924.1.p1 GENE.GHVS01012924.1~~GHVS01012924.1.p1  ORF type:complete len:340 (+),score=63.23 GHVS01012924.1:164-1183(+)
MKAPCVALSFSPLHRPASAGRRLSTVAYHLRPTTTTMAHVSGSSNNTTSSFSARGGDSGGSSFTKSSSCRHRSSSTTSASAEGAYVHVEEMEDKAVGVVRLNRPKALNALSDELRKELVASLKALDQNDKVRAIVLTGVGKAFAAGADIKQMLSRDYAQASKQDLLAAWNDIQKIRKPIVAAVNGYALGGGCELSMMCDIIIAADGAKFGQPEILLGTIPGMGGSQRLTRAVGKSRAMEWILTGRQIDAKEACEAGLVSRVVPKESLEAEAVELAAQIAQFSLPAITACKECINRSYESPLQEGLLFERRSFHSTFATADRTEGMTAFAEKRKPIWKHE